MEYFKQYIVDFISILNEMSPYLLLGFLFAGILHVFFPQQKVNKYLGNNNFMSVMNAALIGVPLPLCSCGVIPTGISFYKNGASKGSSVSFLISTPQTGIDSILVTYSLLGLPFALLRPIIAFITGITGGLFTNIFDKKNKTSSNKPLINTANVTKKTKHNKFTTLLHYAFIEFLSDIAKWLIIGIIIAATISVIIPDDFFTSTFKNEFLNMLLILAASIPVYVCATASVPIAAVLMLKGLSPGAALVLLMAGPATNVATLTVIGKTLGKKPLITYLISIISGALFFGILINTIFPATWFDLSIHSGMAEHHSHGLLPFWLKISSSIVLGSLIMYSFINQYIKKQKEKLILQTQNGLNMKFKEFIVEGMTCNHCKSAVENGLSNLEEIDEAIVDLSSKKVKLTGKNIDTEKVKNTIQQLGYVFKGEV